jgi:hypothetical protein
MLERIAADDVHAFTPAAAMGDKKTAPANIPRTPKFAAWWERNCRGSALASHCCKAVAQKTSTPDADRIESNDPAPEAWCA